MEHFQSKVTALTITTTSTSTVLQIWTSKQNLYFTCNAVLGASSELRKSTENRLLVSLLARVLLASLVGGSHCWISWWVSWSGRVLLASLRPRPDWRRPHCHHRLTALWPHGSVASPAPLYAHGRHSFWSINVPCHQFLLGGCFWATMQIFHTKSRGLGIL